MEFTFSGMRFLTPTDLAKPRGALKKIIEFLQPVEARFGELVSEALGDGSDPKLEIMRSPRYVDKAVLE